MKPPPQISLLVPYRAGTRARQRNWTWLKKYWKHELPRAEIVMGRSTSEVFSKTEAVNDAASRARGNIFVILDCDCYIRGDVVQECADRIEASELRNRPLWFVPYRMLYRLTAESSEAVRASDPSDPLRLPTPPPEVEFNSTAGSAGIGRGHWFGAMIQIMSAEAFRSVGGMDPRFAGWGGEDVAFVRALDTLYGKHKSTANDVLHLWHANIGETYTTRMWKNQVKPQQNGRLSMRYAKATGDRVAMRALVDEGLHPEVASADQT